MTHPPVLAQPQVGGSCLHPVIQDGRALLPLRRRGGGTSPLFCDRSLTIELNNSATNRFLNIQTMEGELSREHALIDIAD